MKENIQTIQIEEEMKKSYIDYAMSVIIGRALPDVRDGLKPVHRRILFAMKELGLTPDKPYRKAARIVGDVLGKYHPHGDSAVYDTMVRLAQDFSIRYPLVDGHGNFGSVDGDSAAAMRYTEAKLSPLAMELLADINKDTVDFDKNFDETLEEPTVLPSKFPNLLVNGSSGIAVGMATNIPPHNLAEVIDGVIMMIENPEVDSDDLMKTVKGPDFPTGALIMGKQGIKSAYTTGRGSIKIRAKAEIETMEQNKNRIIVSEIPYQVNKAKLIEKIAEMVKDKKINGITDLRDESDREGMRIVIELKRDANPNVVLNQLYKNTQLQMSFGVIMLALVKGQPKVLNLREMIWHYLNHQKEVITRRTRYDLKKAQDRSHILEGIKIALDNLDAVINLIRKSKTVIEAKKGLMDSFNLTEKQAQAILDMRLQRLTGLEREKVEEEYKELQKKIAYFKSILDDEQNLLKVIKDELLEVKDKFKDKRRTKITKDQTDIETEDLIEEQDIVITLTKKGYIKRLPLTTYKSQRRGGKGIIGFSSKEKDIVKNFFTTTTHYNLLFFTNKGNLYRFKAYEIPEAGRTAKGMPIVNLLDIKREEKITAVIPIKEFDPRYYLLMVTKYGIAKKTVLSEYESTRSGITAINLKNGDDLIGVELTDGKQEVIIGTRKGKSIRFAEKAVSATGRTAQGVIGIRLAKNDYVSGMDLINEKEQLLVITEKGFGKKTNINEYRTQSRGGKGIILSKTTDKTGDIIDLMLVNNTKEEEILIISTKGTIIRLEIENIRSISRNSQGVKLMRLSDDDTVSAVALIGHYE